MPEPLFDGNTKIPTTVLLSSIYQVLTFHSDTFSISHIIFNCLLSSNFAQIKYTNIVFINVFKLIPTKYFYVAPIMPNTVGQGVEPTSPVHKVWKPECK